MKRILIVSTAIAAFVAGTSAAARAATPTPFPSATVDVGGVFVAAQTVTTGNVMTNYFAPGNTVVFRAYAVIAKSKKFVGADDVKYFYITIPNSPNVKLKYDPTAAGATKQMPFVGTWTIPANYAAGSVPFYVRIKLKGRQTGHFTQTAVTPSLLTVSSTVSTAFTPAPTSTDTGLTGTSGNIDMSIYADSVNGSSPVGVGKRQAGCSQTNVYKVGEQVVFRVWGVDLDSGAALTTDNVDTATVSIAGQPDVKLNFGAHGTIQFWSAPWVIPTTMPIGTTVAHITFKTLDGKTGTFDYALNIIP